MQRIHLAGSTGLDYLLGDDSGASSGRRDGMYLCDCGFFEHQLI